MPGLTWQAHTTQTHRTTHLYLLFLLGQPGHQEGKVLGVHRVLGVLHRVPGVLHRVLRVLHRVPGVLHRV